MCVKISVVIPTWQRPQLLIQCLQALFNQSLEPSQYEIIVVTDGPDHVTCQAIASLQKEKKFVRCMELDKKRGPAAARNIGWLNARGAIVAFTDDDCLPDRNWLLELIQNINPENLEAATGRIKVPRAERPTDHEQNTAGLETAEFVTANCVCTKKALIAIGGFDERFTAAWREDSDLEFKLLKRDIPIKRLENALVVHPVRATTWGSSIRDQRKTTFNALLYKIEPHLYRKKIQPVPPILYYFIVSSALVVVVSLILKNTNLALAGGACWSLLTIYFIGKRLYGKSLAPSHFAEMVYTSVVIPFASLYWHWYGAITYRVWFF